MVQLAPVSLLPLPTHPLTLVICVDLLEYPVERLSVIFRICNQLAEPRRRKGNPDRNLATSDAFQIFVVQLLNLFCHDVLLLINWYRPCSSSWILTIRLRQRSLSGKQSMAWRPPLLLWRSRRLPVGQGRPRRRHLAQMPQKAQPHPLEPLVGGAARFSIKTRGETRSVLMMSLRLVARHQLDELLLVHLLVCQIRPIMEQRVRRDGRWSVLCRLPALDMD